MKVNGFDTIPYGFSTEVQIPVGWAVCIIPIWAWDAGGDSPEKIEGIEVEVIEVCAKNIKIMSGGDLNAKLMLRLRDDCFIALSRLKQFQSFADAKRGGHGDTHDLGDKMFPTKDDAEEWAIVVRTRWGNPEPWRNFITL